jgi:transglutaminase-like putative cysteine protease
MRVSLVAVPARRMRGLAVLLALAMVTAAAWGPALSPSPASLLPCVVWAVLPAVLAMTLLPARAAAAAAALAAPAVVLAAGVPLATLTPGGWGHLAAGLAGGVAGALGRAGHDPASPDLIAGVGLAAGTLWTAGAALMATTTRPGMIRRTRLDEPLGFALLGAPWLIAVGAGLSRPWEGAVVFVAGVLWFCPPWAAGALAVLVAVPATALASVIAPDHWFRPRGAGGGRPIFTTLDVDPSYGPLPTRSTGATMLTITAPEPALWRMETLDYVDGSWGAVDTALPHLPEPAARREVVRVRVVGLKEGLVAAPGPVDRVWAPEAATPTSGGGVLLARAPAPGSTYRVEAEVVRATAAQLSRDHTPVGGRVRAYTELRPDEGTPPRGLSLLSVMSALLGRRVPPPVDPRVALLAHRLARGAHSEWGIVSRVERYLADSGRFRYTTNVPEPGPEPLADFLLRTHAGYCQQFAGAAALLLRLAGVPARVVVGFATGRQVRPHQYDVRDRDAHEWIEVYFEGYGWIPFNPTPAAGPAVVAGSIDPLLGPARSGGSEPVMGVCAGLVAVVALALAAGALRRRRRNRVELMGDWLRRIASRAGGDVGPATTLSDLRERLSVMVGPCTGVLAADLERVRFGVGAVDAVLRPRTRVARALLEDLGPVRSVLFLARRPDRR